MTTRFRIFRQYRFFVVLTITAICISVMAMRAWAAGLTESQANANPITSQSAVPKGIVPAFYSSTAPLLDGRDDDVAWSVATEESPAFVRLGKQEVAQNTTSTKCIYTKDALYFFFRITEKLEKMKCQTSKRDGGVWVDSSIELFLFPNYRSYEVLEQPGDKQYYHLAFNADGVLFDEVGEAGPSSYDGKWEVVTQHQADGWAAEVKIPYWMTLNWAACMPGAMSVWRWQIGRNSPEEGHSSLFPTTGIFRMTGNFGYLVFVGSKLPRNLQRQMDDSNILQPLWCTMRKSLSEVTESLNNPTLEAEHCQLTNDFTQLTAAIASASDVDYLSNRDQWIAKAQSLSHRLLSWQRMRLTSMIAAKRLDFAVIPHSTMRDDEIVTPYTLPDFRAIGETVRITMAPNEYEPGSLVIWSQEALTNLTVKISDLVGSAGTISATMIDPYWVKCWYQGSVTDVVHTGKVLTPELLLHNPELAQVDLKAETNLKPYGKRGFRKYPDDAAQIQPLPLLDARMTQQLWLTAQPVQKTVRPGIYRGAITLTSDTKNVTVPLEVEILEFELSNSPIFHGLYINSNWGSVTQERARIDMDNLLKHGCTRIQLVEREADLGKVVGWMKDAGMNTEKIYLSNINPWGFPEKAKPGVVTATVKKARAILEPLGVKEIYVYMIDEARGERLRDSCRLATEAHAAGAKTWTAVYSDYFDIAGKFIDFVVMAHGPVARELVDKIHAVGSEIACYANPQGGLERPEIYRHNYGIYLWQAGYDGGMTWAWNWPFGKLSPGAPDPWDDFDDPHWRDHNMVYETQNGAVDTIQWEGWREGYDDCRYLGTLIAAITDARAAGRVEAAVKAEKWVETLRNDRQQLKNLEALRSDIIKQIRILVPQ